MNATRFEPFELGLGMRVDILPLLEDNCGYLLVWEDQAVAFDAPDGDAIFHYLIENHLQLRAIVNTHAHSDHVQGNQLLLQHTHCEEVYGPDHPGIPGLRHALQDGDVLELGPFRFDVIGTPGHTQHDLSYHESNHGICFCGDTLFVGGCGRLFEGSPSQMWNSLKRLRALPQDTALFCGHDYARENFAFAAARFPQVSVFETRLEAARAQALMPSSVKMELESNVMWMADQPEIAGMLDMRNEAPEDVFAKIRSLRNFF